MKPSEALRIGRAIRPQARTNYVVNLSPEAEEPCYGTCDLGAMYEAVIGTLPPISTEENNQNWKKVNDALGLHTLINKEQYPLDVFIRYKTTAVDTMVYYLNDDYGWPTEKTIAYLESLGL